MSPLLLLLPLLLATATATAKTIAVASVTAAAASTRDDGGGGPPSRPSPVPPATPPWPEQFHAVVITNLSARGGGLQLIDLYYDWPRGRDLNIVRDQLSREPQWNVEWANGTAFLFDAASCATFQFAVGLLPSAAQPKKLKKEPLRSGLKSHETNNQKFFSFRSLGLALTVRHLFIFVASPSPLPHRNKLNPAHPKELNTKPLCSGLKSHKTNKQTKTLLVLISWFGFGCLALVYICRLAFSLIPTVTNQIQLTQKN
ncbi:uncharacterized protein [Miscanthus floridulus]|uniref:uncharacterized protein n=1 Tax=Miscanthus floridulus TaxID=154761 RepID=UPI00345A5A95